MWRKAGETDNPDARLLDAANTRPYHSPYGQRGKMSRDLAILIAAPLSVMIVLIWTIVIFG